MSFLNVEIKARIPDPSAIRDYLITHGAVFKGKDVQTDTYFNVPHGRLKLREGNVETCLIYYERENISGPKNSHFRLVQVDDTAGLKAVLENTIGVKGIVRKEREIYFIKNVKFHIDLVPGLGSFVEIEAGNMLAALSQQQLQDQCNFYLDAFGIQQEDLVAESYSDAVMNEKTTT